MSTVDDSLRRWALVAKIGVVLASIAWAAWTVLPGLLEERDPNVGAVAQAAGGGGPSSYSATTRGRAIWLSVPNRNKPVILKRVHKASVRALAMSGDGKRMASSDGAEIAMWDTPSKKRVDSVRGKVARVDVLVFYGSKLLAFGESDAMIDVWDADSGKLMASLPVAIPDEAKDAFRLDLPLRGGKPADKADIKPAEYESVKDSDGRAALLSDDGEGGIWKLRDNVSGEFVRSYNDGWTDSSGDPPPFDFVAPRGALRRPPPRQRRDHLEALPSLQSGTGYRGWPDLPAMMEPAGK